MEVSKRAMNVSVCAFAVFASSQAYAAVSVSDILGFENASAWTSTTVIPTLSNNHTQGASSLSVKAVNYTVIKSVPFSIDAALAPNISLDILLPTPQPNPQYFGAVQLYFDCPSKGINNSFVGQVDLTGKPLNQFITLSFSTANVASHIGSSCSNFDVSIAINAASGVTGPYLLDNLQGISPNMVITETVDVSDVPDAVAAGIASVTVNANTSKFTLELIGNNTQGQAVLDEVVTANPKSTASTISAQDNMGNVLNISITSVTLMIPTVCDPDDTNCGKVASEADYAVTINGIASTIKMFFDANGNFIPGQTTSAALSNDLRLRTLALLGGSAGGISPQLYFALSLGSVFKAIGKGAEAVGDPLSAVRSRRALGKLPVSSEARPACRVSSRAAYWVPRPRDALAPRV
jgi:hypothetical protein